MTLKRFGEHQETKQVLIGAGYRIDSKEPIFLVEKYPIYCPQQGRRESVC
ncbi:hypothetical protein JG687_00012234 [Phytophthora cactorum]|uniref:Uncharacterized protein n=1 Tax=Phytophthora cactorum TaxID=29920 RepID=A0A8T1U7N3_9STRA|nr:hypothetical protein JG687_00012234 [Phytophthora cactorum]